MNIKYNDYKVPEGWDNDKTLGNYLGDIDNIPGAFRDDDFTTDDEEEVDEDDGDESTVEYITDAESTITDVDYESEKETDQILKKFKKEVNKRSYTHILSEEEDFL